MRSAAIVALLLLVTVPTCATLPTHGEMPPVPSYAPTALGPIPIVRVPDLMCLDAPAYGCFHTNPYRIELRAGMSREFEWEVTYHELFHVATYVARVGFRDSTAADTIANIVARERMVELRAGWPR